MSAANRIQIASRWHVRHSSGWTGASTGVCDSPLSRLWLVGGLEHLYTFVIFPYIGNVIIPTDELIFFRGIGQPPTSWSLADSMDKTKWCYPHSFTERWCWLLEVSTATGCIKSPKGQMSRHQVDLSDCGADTEGIFTPQNRVVGCCRLQQRSYSSNAQGWP